MNNLIRNTLIKDLINVFLKNLIVLFSKLILIRNSIKENLLRKNKKVV